MAIAKTFNCDECGAEGKITIKGEEFSLSDVVYCPVCSGNIHDEELDNDDED